MKLAHVMETGMGKEKPKTAQTEDKWNKTNQGKIDFGDTFFAKAHEDLHSKFMEHLNLIESQSLIKKKKASSKDKAEKNRELAKSPLRDALREIHAKLIAELEKSKERISSSNTDAHAFIDANIKEIKRHFQALEDTRLFYGSRSASQEAAQHLKIEAGKVIDMAEMLHKYIHEQQNIEDKDVSLMNNKRHIFSKKEEFNTHRTAGTLDSEVAKRMKVAEDFARAYMATMKKLRGTEANPTKEALDFHAANFIAYTYLFRIQKVLANEENSEDSAQKMKELAEMAAKNVYNYEYDYKNEKGRDVKSVEEYLAQTALGVSKTTSWNIMSDDIFEKNDKMTEKYGPLNDKASVMSDVVQFRGDSTAKRYAEERAHKLRDAIEEQNTAINSTLQGIEEEALFELKQIDTHKKKLEKTLKELEDDPEFLETEEGKAIRDALLKSKALFERFDALDGNTKNYLPTLFQNHGDDLLESYSEALMYMNAELTESAELIRDARKQIARFPDYEDRKRRYEAAKEKLDAALTKDPESNQVLFASLLKAEVNRVLDNHYALLGDKEKERLQLADSSMKENPLGTHRDPYHHIAYNMKNIDEMSPEDIHALAKSYAIKMADHILEATKISDKNASTRDAIMQRGISGKKAVSHVIFEAGKKAMEPFGQWKPKEQQFHHVMHDYDSALHAHREAEEVVEPAKETVKKGHTHVQHAVKKSAEINKNLDHAVTEASKLKQEEKDLSKEEKQERAKDRKEVAREVNIVKIKLKWWQRLLNWWREVRGQPPKYPDTPPTYEEASAEPATAAKENNTDISDYRGPGEPPKQPQQMEGPTKEELAELERRIKTGKGTGTFEDKVRAQKQQRSEGGPEVPGH